MSRFVLVALLACAGPAVAQPVDPAELFPPSTLAYAEVRDPAQIADAIAAIVKGTALEDGLNLIHDRRDTTKDPRLFAGSPALSSLATLTSLEFLAEVRKLRGAAVGLTGLTKSYDPKIAAVVLLGDSSAAALLVKAYLANEATFRRVAVLDGVPLYQSRAFAGIGFDPNTGKPIIPEPAKATEGPLELTYALTPGFFIVASNKEAAADVLVRCRGTGKDSLASGDSFKTFLAARTPGVNFCVRFADLVAAADTARKNKKELLDPALVAYLKLILNVRSVPTLVGRVSLQPTGLTCAVTLDRKGVSPLFELFAGTVPPTSMRVCPTNLAAAWTVALPPKEKRTRALLQLADAVSTAEGEVGKLPSEWLAEVEQKSSLPIRGKFLASVEACSLLAPSKQELPAKVEPLPMLALHLESEAAANEWVEALPKLLSALQGLGATPTRSAETIQGVPVFSIVDGRRSIHYARSGSSVVVGLDRKLVAACCTDASQKNLLTDFTTRKVVLPDASTTAYGAILPLGLALSEVWTNSSSLPVLGGRLDLPVDGLANPFLGFQQSFFTDKELTAAFTSCPPIVGRVLKNARSVTAEIRFDFGPQGAKPVLENLIPIIEKLGATGSATHGRFFLDR